VGGKVGLVEMYIHRLRSDSAEIKQLFCIDFGSVMAASDRIRITWHGISASGMTGVGLYFG